MMISNKTLPENGDSEAFDSILWIRDLLRHNGFKWQFYGKSSKFSFWW